MTMYYLDIETTGLNPRNEKIITVQYAPIERGTGNIGNLTILKEWEYGEKGILSKFIQDTSVTTATKFDFVSVGYNLKFEQKFLHYKSKEHNMQQINILLHPHIDLHPVGIMMNGGEFRGSSLDDLTNKPQDGSQIPTWYNQQNYGQIEEYIRTETQAFALWYKWLLKRLPRLRQEWDERAYGQLG